MQRELIKSFHSYVLIAVLILLLTISNYSAMHSFQTPQSQQALSTSFLYAGVLASPGKLLKIDLNTFEIVNSLTLGNGERVHAVEATDKYLYAGLFDTPVVIQVQLSNFTKGNSVTLSGFTGQPSVKRLKVVGDYLYVVGGGLRLYKLNTETLQVINYTDIVVPQGMYITDVNSANEYLYLNVVTQKGSPNWIVKLRIPDLSESNRLQLSVQRIMFSTIDGNYLFVVYNTDPDIGDEPGLLRIELTNFQENGKARIGPLEAGRYSDFVVRYGDYLYVNGDTPGRVYKIRLSDFTWTGYLNLSENGISDVRLAEKYLYLPMRLGAGSLSPTSKILKVDLDSFKEVAKLDTGEDGLGITQIVILPGAKMPQETATITGTVTDANTSTPVPGATIAINEYSIVSNQSGGYSLSNLPLGYYTISVNAAEYETKNTTLNPSSPGVYTVNFQIRKIPVSTITGIVMEAKTENSIAGALVTANGYSTTTDSAGRYTLRVQPGNFRIAVNASRYKESSQTLNASTVGTYTVNFTLFLLEDSNPEVTGYTFPINQIITAAIVSGLVISIALWFFLKDRRKLKSPHSLTSKGS